MSKPISLSVVGAGSSAQPKPINPPHGWAVFRLGFRPFYLLGVLAAALLVPTWVATLLGVLQPSLALSGYWWHAHEMLYGFAVAIIVGFLLTAGMNWTGLQTPRGGALAALAALWLAARLAAFSPWYALFAVLDSLLLPMVAVIFLRLLLRAGNRRNLPLAGILGALALCNLWFHAVVGGLLQGTPQTPLHAALGLITLVECVIAGRVIPSFTAAVNPGLRLAPQPRLEVLAMAVTVLAVLAWVVLPWTALAALLCAGAGLLQALRMAGWGPLRARMGNMVWILHAAYAWLVLGWFLLAAAHAGWLATSLAVHALGVGATGGLIIGMVTRTARGHTGRPIQAGVAESMAFAGVMLAALARVGLPLLRPDAYAGALVLAALLWSTALALYLWRYTPWLLSTRLDGKDG